MSKFSLGDISSTLLDPLLSDNFKLVFANLPTIFSTPANTTALNIQCKNVTKPGVTLNSAPAQLFGHEIEFATNKTFSHDMSVTYIENRDMQIHTILDEWCEYIRGTQTQHGNFKADYARDATLFVYDQRGAKIKEFIIVNCFPTSVPETSFDGSSSNILEVAVTFKYDFYYEAVSGLSFSNAVPNTTNTSGVATVNSFGGTIGNGQAA